jgi:uncharacterized RDD family membrane protein YckC
MDDDQDVAPCSDSGTTIGYFDPTREVRYAGFWVRACALLIDSLILWVPLMLVAVAGMWLTQDSHSYLARRGEGLLRLIAMFGAWLYFAGMESSSRQATVGKGMFGLIVTDEAGRALSMGRASARFVSKIISAIPIYLGFMMAGFTGKKQALHDLISGTVVVYSPRQSA